MQEKLRHQEHEALRTEQRSEQHRLGVLAVYVSTALIGLNGILAKVIPLNAVTQTQLRSAIAFMVLFAISIVFRKTQKVASAKQAMGALGLGLLLGVHWVTFFESMLVSTVAIGIISLYSYPLITTLIEPIFLNRWPHLKDIIAAVIIFVALYAMAMSSASDSNHGNVALGVFFGVISAVLVSMRNIASRYWFYSVPSDTLMFYQFLAIALGLFVFVDFEGVAGLSLNSWLWVAVLGVVSTAIGHTLVTYGLKKLSAKKVSVIGCMQPALAVIGAFYFLGEVPSWPVIIAGIVILSVALYETLTH